LSGLEPIVKMFKRGKGLYTCMTISLWSCPFTILGGFERLMGGLSQPKPPLFTFMVITIVKYTTWCTRIVIWFLDHNIVCLYKMYCSNVKSVSTINCVYIKDRCQFIVISQWSMDRAQIYYEWKFNNRAYIYLCNNIVIFCIL